MRERLRSAVEALLADRGLAGASDAVRLAAVVLLAKTNAAELTAQVTAGELGRWLGVTGSQVSHAVRPFLQRGAVASEDVTASGSRRTASIRWRVEAYVWARRHGAADHPLRLSRPELATLLRLCEALFGPGWSETPPGALAGRRGHGAATDRLGLLLAVLNCREDGRVRLCGGAVDSRGRLAATMARLLGRSTAEGERVVARLEACEVVAVHAGARERLVVPAVAAAYRRMRAGARVAGRAPVNPREGRRSVPRSGEATAGGDQIPSQGAKSQVKPGFCSGSGEEASASLHADHSPVAEVVEKDAGSGGFSGEGRGGSGSRPVRVRGREDQAPARARAGSHRDQVPDHGAAQGALRAEKRISSPLSLSLSRRVPQVAQLLARIVGEVTGHQRRMLDRLVSGLLLEGEDDAMIIARLRERLAPLATGDPARPWAFRRDGLSWALRIGLPYARGGLTLVPCASRGCGQFVHGRATDRVRCDDCEIAAMDAALADRQGVPSLEELERMMGLDSSAAGSGQVPAQRAEGPDDASTRSESPPLAAGEVEEPVLPQVVREQIDVIAAADPAAARVAEQAAAAMYGPVADDETEDQQRYRTSKASADFYAVIGRFGDVLAAHYERSPA